MLRKDTIFPKAPLRSDAEYFAECLDVALNKEIMDPVVVARVLLLR
jgi:hypothetical protein